jgi:TonB-dependent receptor-like protein/carboxypeptidase-like protein
MNPRLIPLALLLALLSPADARAGSAAMEGTLKGVVLDRATQRPLVGANVLVLDRELGSIADAEGRFVIPAVPVGVHRLQVSMIGYDTAVRTDVVVKHRRITSVEVELNERAVGMDETVVSADYFAGAEEEVVSTVSFSYEEIRRSPGSAGDISRLLQALPAINMATDQRNDLIVRGGSPAENLVIIDNIEVPNLNHFPTQGATGGPIGLLNTDLIDDVNFSAGGFSAAHGDRMSSVMVVDLREGNRDEFDGQLNLDMAGAGFVVEGPLSAGRGSWLASARRSYLELIVNAIGTGAVPRYSDVQSKLTYDLTDAHQVSLLQLSGFDTIEFEPEDADEMDDFTDMSTDQHVVGTNWRWLWSDQGYTNTSLAFAYADFSMDVRQGDAGQVDPGPPIYRNESQERDLTLRSSFHYRLRRGTDLDWGLVGRRIFSSYDIFFKSDTNRVGRTTPEIRVDRDVETTKAGLYASLRQRFGLRLAATAGVRFDYFDFNKEYDLAPRLGLTYEVDERTSLNAAYGIYYQNLALSLLVQHPDNALLENPRADHYVLGLRRRLTASTLLTVEVYLKEYSELPYNPNDSTSSVIDGYAEYGSPTPGRLVGGGKARSYGLEALVQKKLARDVYGSASYSYSVSRYTDLTGRERNRSFDNRHLVSLIAGYRPSDRWEYSLRWSYAGGRPCTPFDSDLSARLGTGVVDIARVNAERHPAYHRLDLRFDHRQHYERFNLVSYFSLLNAYNRKNLFALYWDEDEQTTGRINQWTIMPVGGFELEF